MIRQNSLNPMHRRNDGEGETCEGRRLFGSFFVVERTFTVVTSGEGKGYGEERERESDTMGGGVVVCRF